MSSENTNKYFLTKHWFEVVSFFRKIFIKHIQAPKSWEIEETTCRAGRVKGCLTDVLWYNVNTALLASLKITMAEDYWETIWEWNRNVDLYVCHYVILL